MMTDAGLNKDEAKAFYDRISPKTATDASTFIDGFEAMLRAWREYGQQQEPGK
jgi:hypothetical protein